MRCKGHCLCLDLWNSIEATFERWEATPPTEHEIRDTALVAFKMLRCVRAHGGDYRLKFVAELQLLAPVWWDQFGLGPEPIEIVDEQYGLLRMARRA